VATLDTCRACPQLPACHKAVNSQRGPGENIFDGTMPSMSLQHGPPVWTHLLKESGSGGCAVWWERWVKFDSGANTTLCFARSRLSDRARNIPLNL
jgi:hypothetical protein